MSSHINSLYYHFAHLLHACCHVLSLLALALVARGLPGLGLVHLGLVAQGLVRLASLVGLVGLVARGLVGLVGLGLVGLLGLRQPLHLKPRPRVWLPSLCYDALSLVPIQVEQHNTLEVLAPLR